MEYQSFIEVASATTPGVTLLIRRVSFERRLDLLRRTREHLRRAEFLEAGAAGGDQLEARVLEHEAARMYLEWGIAELRGLTIDGKPATVESLLSSGPESLTQEAVRLITAELGLSEAERKN